MAATVEESTPPDMATTTRVFFASLGIPIELNFVIINDIYSYILYKQIK
jgi:hypothetical protein